MKGKLWCSLQPWLSRFLNHYGMLGVLLLLGLFFSILTLQEQHPMGAAAARDIQATLSSIAPRESSIIIIARESEDDLQFARRLNEQLQRAGYLHVETLLGDPTLIRQAFAAFTDSGHVPAYLATLQSYAPIVETLKSQFPVLTRAEVVVPPSYRWPTFLLPDNLRNVANQIAVIAIIAIGMTLVIITAGIDLSVGSLIALSAVVTAWLIGQWGAEQASLWGMIAGGLGGMALCSLTGLFSGFMITTFRIPPFIATLAMMQVAAGFAYIISQGKPIYQLPESLTVLGRGAEPLFSIPYAVLMMILLYVVAHILMTRTTLGRYIYAVGGNEEAARLAGIRVKRVLLFVYVLSGALAGLGGVVMASQLKSGAPTYGLTYELYVIAAVVVGGTSLSGGEGRILGTLIGALIIAVIQNGMNLTNVESYTQKVVLGLVILGAVLLDRLKQRDFQIKKWFKISRR